MSMKEKIQVRIKKLSEIEDLDEMNVTGNLDGGSGPVRTKYAFKNGKAVGKKIGSFDIDVEDLEKKNTLKQENVMSKYKKLMNLSEITYKDFKNDDSSTNRQKVNQRIKEINRSLYDIEHIVGQTYKLKHEMGMDTRDIWKSSRGKLLKIKERLHKVAKKIMEMDA